MKRIFLAMLALAFLTSMSYGRVIVKGDSNTYLGKYTIELLDETLMIAGEELKCYEIAYENLAEKVRVYVDKEKNCKNYVVVSGELAVMYKCNGKFFGVNKVDKKYRDAGFQTDDENLDRSDYFHQKVLAQGITEEFDATRLIAAFYPELIKQ